MSKEETVQMQQDPLKVDTKQLLNRLLKLAIAIRDVSETTPEYQEMAGQIEAVATDLRIQAGLKTGYSGEAWPPQDMTLSNWSFNRQLNDNE